ncbi:MAG: Sec-independent protein translocase protein TatB [Gammaproteobacteria bacterium]
MFDFGFWELAVIMVIALLVVGPERLPALAGKVGRFLGKARKMAASGRSDIVSEIKAAELKEILDKQQGEIGELKEMLKGAKNEIEEELDFKDDDQEEGDHELISAVENHIESTKQQELSLSSENSANADKHGDD